jgi:hypothetical protein
LIQPADDPDHSSASIAPARCIPAHQGRRPARDPSRRHDQRLARRDGNRTCQTGYPPHRF